MTKSKKDTAVKKDDNSLLVGLTVTSICAAAVIGYVAGQVKIADTVFKQLNIMATTAAVQEQDDGTKSLSEDTFSALVKVCEGILPNDAATEEEEEETVDTMAQ